MTAAVSKCKSSFESNLGLYGITASAVSDYYFAFFGTDDHYRKSGIVSVGTWRKYFGNTMMMYEGTHFTEEEHIYAKILPLICKLLGINK